MPNRTVNFEVTANDKVVGYTISINDQPIHINNNKGSVRLETGKKHPLVWTASGEPGGKLGIVGKIGQDEVVSVKSSTIPPDRNGMVGHKWFNFD